MFFKIVFLKVCNIHRKMPLLESLFSKVASLKTCNFIERRLQHGCFPVNIAKFLRKFYFKNTTGGYFCSLNSSGIWWYRETDDISSFFSLSVLLKLLKQGKLITFENYNECKTKHLKKVATRFDKKIATWQMKRRIYCCGP